MRNASYQMKSAVPSNIRWETIEWEQITGYVEKLQQRIYCDEIQGNKIAKVCKEIRQLSI